MTDDDRNNPLRIAAMIAVGIVGAYSTVILPLLVRGVAEARDLPAARTGWTATAEMGGIAVGALVVGLIVARADRRWLAVLSALASAIGNLASPLAESFTLLLALRVLAGFGGGGLLAVMAAAIGDTAKPDRNFAIFVAAAFVLAALGFRLLPPLMTADGVDSLFLLLAAVSAAAAVAAFALPPRGRQAAVSAGAAPGGLLAAPTVLGLLGILSYYIGIGTVWPMMARIGAATGASQEAIDAVLSNASLAAIAGALLATALAARVDRLAMMTTGLVGVSITLAAIAVSPTVATFTIAPLAFLFFWNMVVPFLWGTLAVLDPSGRAVAINMTLQYIGFAGGPLIAGVIVGGGALLLTWTGVAGALGSLACFALALRLGGARPAAAL